MRLRNEWGRQSAARWVGSILTAVGMASCSGPSDLGSPIDQIGTTSAQPASTATTPSVVSSTTATTTATFPITAPLRAPIVVAVAGDTSFTNGLDERDPLSQVAHLLSAPT